MPTAPARFHRDEGSFFLSSGLAVVQKGIVSYCPSFTECEHGRASDRQHVRKAGVYPLPGRLPRAKIGPFAKAGNLGTRHGPVFRGPRPSFELTVSPVQYSLAS